MEEEREIEGITEDTPDDITDFVRANDVADKYTVMLKQKPDGGGTAQTLRSFANYYPNVNTLGREWGPGSYSLVFSWRAKGLNNKMETVTKEFKIELPARAWLHEHNQFLLERAKKMQLQTEEELKVEAMRNRIVGPTAPVQPVSDFDNLKKMLDLAKSIGVPIGGPAKPEPKEKEKKSFSERMVDMAPAITAFGAVVAPIVVALITRPKPPDDKSTQNLLLQHILTQSQKPQEDGVMKSFVPFLMGTMKQLMDFKQSMEPEEKQGLVEKIFDKLAPMVPQVLALATMPKPQLEANPMVKMARNLPDVKNMQADTELAFMGIQRLDEVYGFQQANDIMTVFGLQRPPELQDNYQTFPSVGFGPDGLPVKSPESVQEDLRSAKMPDQSPNDTANDDNGLEM